MSTTVIIGTTGSDPALTGTSGRDILIGRAGGDTLDGGAGSDALLGGKGNDILIYDEADWLIDGGSGMDTLRFLGTGQTLNFSCNRSVSHIEQLQLWGGGNHRVTLSAYELRRLSDSDKLRVWGDASSQLSFSDSGWAFSGLTSDGFLVYKNCGATLETQFGMWVNGFSGNAVISYTAGSDSSVMEDENAITLVAVGSLNVTDPNGQRALMQTVQSAAGNVGNLVLSAGGPYAGTSNGNYVYSVSNLDFRVQSLGATESRTDQFTVTNIDGSTLNMSFTTQGQNDALILQPLEGADTLSGFVDEFFDNEAGENTGYSSFAGQFSVSDVDLTDQLYAWFDSPIGALGTLTDLHADAPDANGKRVVHWTYQVADSDLDFLGEGDQRHQNFTLYISDRPQGTLGATVRDTSVDVTLTGKEDAPFTVDNGTGQFDGSVAELPASVPGAGSPDSLHIVNGSFQIQDVDSSDTLRLLPVTSGATYGRLEVVDFSEPDAHGMRTVSWRYIVTDAELGPLGEGPGPDQNFVISFTDERVTVGQEIRIHTTGASDGPSFAGDAFPPPIVEFAEPTTPSAADLENRFIHRTQGDILVSNVAAGATFSFTALPGMDPAIGHFNATMGSINASGQATVHWEYRAADCELDFMNLGDYLSTQFQLSVTNPGGATGVGTVTIGFQGNTDTTTDPKITFGGTPSADTYSGGPENDLIYGLGGADTLSGGAGVNVIFGGTGNDTLYNGPSLNFLMGQEGNDRVSFSPSSFDTYAWGGSGDDTFVMSATSGTGVHWVMDFALGDKVDIDGSVDATLRYATGSDNLYLPVGTPYVHLANIDSGAINLVGVDVPLVVSSLI